MSPGTASTIRRSSPECRLFTSTPSGAVSGQGKTNYLTVRGEKTASPARRASIAEIRWHFNTIMMVEVADQSAVMWTKPDDFQHHQENPLTGLVGL